MGCTFLGSLIILLQTAPGQLPPSTNEPKAANPGYIFIIGYKIVPKAAGPEYKKVRKGYQPLITKMYPGRQAPSTIADPGLSAPGTKMYQRLKALGTRRYLRATSPELPCCNKG